jgi:hypothetical protein
VRCRCAHEDPLVRDHFADDSPLQGGLRLDPLPGPKQPLSARRPYDLFREDARPVSAGEAEGGVGEVAVARALRRDVDVRDEQILGMHDRRLVCHPDQRDRQLEQGCSSFAPSSRVFSQAAGSKISPRLGPSIWSMNESPVPVITSALFPRSGEISSSAAGKSSWVWPVNTAGCLRSGSGARASRRRLASGRGSRTCRLGEGR